MVKPARRKPVARVVRRIAPGYAERIRRSGLKRATIETVNAGRLSSREREQQSLKALGLRLKVKSSLELADTLARGGEADLALAVLDGALARFPRSSEVLMHRSLMLATTKRDGAAEALLAAGRGDLKSVGFSDIASASLTLLDLGRLGEVRALIRERQMAEETDLGGDVALRILDLAEKYRQGGDLVWIDGDEAIPERALAVFAEWARNDLRWDSLCAVITEFERRQLRTVSSDQLRTKLAEFIRAKGDLSASLELVEPVAERSGDRKSKKLVMQNQVDLGLLKNGWVAPTRRPRADATDGALAYLLHNSLPYTSGGYSTRTHGLLASMVRRGWQVDAITRPQYPADRPEGKDVPRSELESGSVIDGVRYSRILDGSSVVNTVGHIDHFATSVAERAKTERWGVIHAASNHFVGLSAVEAAARVGVPSVYEVRGLWEVTRMSREPHYEETERFAMTEKLEADACRYADHAFAITEGLRSLMIDRGVPADHISLLPNGVDINRFTPSSPDESLRQKLGLEGKIVVGYVGSVLDYEGLELLVDAVKILVDDGLPVALLIVGDGKAFDSVKSRIEQAGISEHVVLPGRVPHAEAESYYSIIDIAPFPRLPLPVTELVSPLKPFEAMAMAKPVVVSSVGALTEIVTDGENGLVFTKGDVNSLAATLARLVDDKDEREQLGAAGRDWVVANRSWDTLSERIVEVYEKLGVPFPAK